MSCAANVHNMTYDEVMASTCGCCKITFDPKPPYNKTDSYASVVLQQSAQTMRRKMNHIDSVPYTCNRTRLYYLFLKDNQVYLQNKSWLWNFRRLHYIGCYKLKQFMTELKELQVTSTKYRCVCKAPSQKECNDYYIDQFHQLLQQYTNGAGFQIVLWKALTARMCEDVANEVLSYMFMSDQMHPTQ